MLLSDLVETSGRVAAARGRTQKIGLLADLLRRVPQPEIEIAVAYLSGAPRQAKLGVASAGVHAAAPERAAERPSLSLSEVDTAFARMAGMTGKGSTGQRVMALADLIGRATAEEQRFLSRLIVGELRQGALEALVLEAVAAAAALPAPKLRRAVMVTGDLPAVAGAVMAGGEGTLARFDIRLFRPVLPMLAETAEDPGDALERLGEAALEYKFDGARVQVHKAGDEVRAYSRQLNDVTPAVPELIEQVRCLPARELILDGEAIALRADGRPHPFQTTMRRFGRRLDVARLADELPLQAFFFDLLLVDGASLLDEPEARRFATLAEVAPEHLLVPRVVASTPEEARRFLETAMARGHEGIMAKGLDSPYEAGQRGQRWLKVKPAQTLDLVVLAAEWGHGRRRGWLSNLHLGARDEPGGGGGGGGFVMLGKTFKGMTDAMLAWQTERLLALEVARDAQTVYVRPELVVEVAFNDVQASSEYPGGLALRFARVRRYRPDKPARAADTIAAVRAIHRRSIGERDARPPPPPRASGKL
jgi:DNA ligase-1